MMRAVPSLFEVPGMYHPGRPLADRPEHHGVALPTPAAQTVPGSAPHWNLAKIAASLSPSQRKAVLGFFFSDDDGATLLAMGIFASSEGWPLTEGLGNALCNHLRAELAA